MDGLVKKLVTGKHPVLFEQRTEDLSELKERLSQGFVFVKFTETQGGTVLGINIDTNLTCLEKADFVSGKGTLQLVGTCVLNFQKVFCFADVDLATRKGTGYLQLSDTQ